MGLLSYFKENDRVPEVPPQNLGSIDEFNGSYIMVVYTPISNITQQIMNKTTFAPTMKGTKIIGVPSKKELDEVFLENMPHAIGVIFNDTFSYKLKIHQIYGNPFLKEDLSAHCWDAYTYVYCRLTKYWKGGFVALQTAINAAIIEVSAPLDWKVPVVTMINFRGINILMKGDVPGCLPHSNYTPRLGSS